MDSYEKKYKEALERARKLKEDTKAIFFEEKNVHVSDYIFPELKESEDEKIRKSLISILKSDFEKDTTIYDISVGDIIAWLEKQGEQKPADKVKPKFKVGDWIVDNCGCVWKIEGLLNQCYLLEGVEGDESRPTIEWVNQTFHLWTIEEAKEGDVLARTNDILSICIFSRFDGINDKFSSFLCRCGLEGEGLGQELSVNGYHDDSKNYVPATKEQRDLLFQKMKEA